MTGLVVRTPIARLAGLVGSILAALMGMLAAFHLRFVTRLVMGTPIARIVGSILAALMGVLATLHLRFMAGLIVRPFVRCMLCH